jgi:hypothetical protein
MAKLNKSWIDRRGRIWEWEETPETIQALKQLHKSVESANVKRKESGSQ